MMDDYGQFVGQRTREVTITNLHIIFTHSLRRQTNNTKH
jgi:hypothetical protein